MMKRIDPLTLGKFFILAAMASALLITISSPRAQVNGPLPPEETASIGKPAPDFTLRSARGRLWHLSDLKRQIVVLEWTNPECPFVRKHYETGAMQALQNKARAEHDVVWLSIVSSAPGKQGYMSPDEARDYMDDVKEKATDRLLDPEGNVGRLYEAKTTPHMYIIDEDGILVYKGAIDDNPSSAHSSVKVAKNYVAAALEDIKAGREVEIAQTRPYGCSVKY